ncbi:hypothetical protein [Clostridium novyi]|uniref:hypothetical protein n=1 Tax=Clostridium novyi TaxID=1542 RepID=UPI0004D6E63D|nr:hypothetical protein [Clostridium novyi]KEH84634.1 hypothetical protein Z967_p0014 [Clostridium novyi A str. 4540]
MNIADTIMDRKCRCQGCKYNDQTYGKRIWNCTHPIPCKDREISEYGCKQGSKEIMVCEICGKPVHPLDAHMGKFKGELITTHIDCWNKAKGYTK